MKDNAEQSTSIWMATASAPRLSPLSQDTRADVCVVGAGIAGMTTAYLLARHGKSVVVVDDGPVGGGQTQRTTAHLSNAIDAGYFEIERLHGEQGAQLTADSHSAAINCIEATVRDEQIDCDFERLDGYLFAPPGDSREVLARELEAARRAGLAAVECVPRAPLRSFDTGPCLRFPRQGQFHPVKYLAGLVRAVQRDGGRIYTDTRAEQIEGGSPARIQMRGGLTVTAAAVVVATNAPVNDRMVMVTKQGAYLTYVVGLRVPRGSIAKALYWDTLDPYHYVRLQTVSSGDAARQGGRGAEPHDVLIVGGEDHKTGQADDQQARYARLEAWARERFPDSGAVDFRWSGQVMESIDGLAFIGRNPVDEPNVFIATGDSGMGMTHGTIAGILLTDLILGRPNPWAALYDPSRKTLRAAGEFYKENINVTGQYTDWLAGGDVSSVGEIALGKGAVLRRGLSMVAVYRDDHGGLHGCSAVCRHLGCIVHWNDAEKTWDCPCHGSRFSRYGQVLNGPANSDLPPANVR
jgi:glycine/D-amino acid oxidase-like deaminating enzyme/nitrite reductase/ring-hydroxylating ferredoxin subunit